MKFYKLLLRSKAAIYIICMHSCVLYVQASALAHAVCVCIRMIPVPGLYGVGLYSGPAASGPMPSKVARHSGGAHATPSVWERNIPLT